MTDSEELRQALDVVSDGPLLRAMTRHNAANFVVAMATLVAAARFALKVWEGDEQIIERDAVDPSAIRYAIQILRDRAREFAEFDQPETSQMLRSVADYLASAQKARR